MALQTKIVTKTLRVGPGRLSFPHLLEEHGFNNSEPKFSTVLLLPPSYDIKPLLAALTDVCEQAWGRDQRKWPSTARKPESVVRDCAEKDGLAGYDEGWHFVSCSSKEKPTIVHADLSPLREKSEVYAGRWANVTMRPFVYNNVSTGVSLGLNNVQLLKNDTVFGRTSVKQDFDPIALDMEEEEDF
ncbi:MAG TPA: ssDNA-binding protein [Polyangia bacterium]|nr:ssDNA-binding protein [Polyangia bacterium]